MKGKLYLIPNVLGENSIEQVIPRGVSTIVSGLDHFIVENVRTARRYIRKLDTQKPIDPLTFYTLNKHTSGEEMEEMTAPLKEGTDMGLMSEAGAPGIADPGEEIVRIAQRHLIRVVPMTGPSSIFLALMGSGLNGESFAFNGYLPIKSGNRIKRIRALEKKSRHEGQTQIFMETPYRNDKLLSDILSHCREDTLLCIASEITTEREMIRTQSIREWKKNTPGLHKKPSIFILSASE
ncbi:MAG: SAM-dependent methyltransferase [Bacteroidales bacterium]|nr:SAM-dependent methyltransferase [Bacteroidales bacterium]